MCQLQRTCHADRAPMRERAYLSGCAPLKRMEAGGIEPPSVVAPSRASTSVVCGLISPGSRFADDLPTGQPILWSHPSGDPASPSGPARFLTPLPESRAEFGATRHLTQLGGECEIVIRTCIDPGGLTRPTGDLGLQLDRRTDHVETWSPPYVPYRGIVPGYSCPEIA